MKKFITRFIIPIIAGSIGLILILAVSVSMVWAVTIKHSESAIVRKLSQALPIPAAKIGSRRLYYRDFLKARDTMRVFIKSDAAKDQGLNSNMDQTLESNIIEKMLTQAALEELAAKNNVSVSDEELRGNFAEVVAAASSTTPDIGLYLLQNFGWTEEDFRQQILKPAMLEQRLFTILQKEDPSEEALRNKIVARLKEGDVVRYLKFPLASGTGE